MELKKADTLLLDCLKSEGTPYPIDTLEGLTASDWTAVLLQSSRHGISPLLYQYLKAPHLKKLVPADILYRLRETYLQNAARNIRMYHRLSKVLRALKDANIPVIVLKGACLAEIIYGKIGMRTMEDVDLLLRKEDLSRCQKLLLKMGYGPQNRNPTFDIHWDLDSPRNINIDEVWERAQPVRIAGVEALALSPEDMLLHLCLHLAFHHLFQLGGLRTLCDIREMLRCYNSRLEWEKILSLASWCGGGRSVHLTLSLAGDLLNVEVAPAAMEALKRYSVDLRAKSWAIEQIFYGNRDILSLSPYFWQLWGAKTAGKKLNLLMKLIFTSRKFLSQNYPAPCQSAKSYLYYIVRIMDHFPRYCRAAWRMLKGNEKMMVMAEQQKEKITMAEWLSSPY